MPVDFFAKEHNRLAVLEFEVTNNDGSAVDLTGAAVTYKIWSTEPGTDTLTPITATVTPVQPTPPDDIWHVTVAWGSTDLDIVDRYYGEGTIVFQNGNTLDVPTLGYHQIAVLERGPTS